MLVVTHRNLDDSMNKEVASLDDAKIFGQKTVRVFGQYINPMKRRGSADVRQVGMLLSAGGAGVWRHSPNAQDSGTRDQRTLTTKRNWTGHPALPAAICQPTSS